MNLKRQAENVNRLLSEIYGTPTRLSNILLDLGFDAGEIRDIRMRHLHEVFSSFSVLIEEVLCKGYPTALRSPFIIAKRFGLDGNEPETLEAIGASFGVTRERIRQIEKRSLQGLRHRARRKLLEEGIRRIVSETLYHHG